MINFAPLTVPITSEEVGQEWLAWFDDIGQAVQGVWSDIQDTPSVTNATVDSVQSSCVVRGTVAYLFLQLNTYVPTGASVYTAPVTFTGTFSQIRDTSSGALIALAVTGDQVDLPTVAGNYEVIVHAPVLIDNKLAQR